MEPQVGVSTRFPWVIFWGAGFGFVLGISYWFRSSIFVGWCFFSAYRFWISSWNCSPPFLRCFFFWFWLLATQFFFSPENWGFHDPVWRSRILFRWVVGSSTNYRILLLKLDSSCVFSQGIFQWNTPRKPTAKGPSDFHLFEKEKHLKKNLHSGVFMLIFRGVMINCWFGARWFGYLGFLLGLGFWGARGFRWKLKDLQPWKFLHGWFNSKSPNLETKIIWPKPPFLSFQMLIVNENTTSTNHEISGSLDETTRKTQWKSIRVRSWRWDFWHLAMLMWFVYAYSHSFQWGRTKGGEGWKNGHPDRKYKTQGKTLVKCKWNLNLCNILPSTWNNLLFLGGMLMFILGCIFLINGADDGPIRQMSCYNLKGEVHGDS